MNSNVEGLMGVSVEKIREMVDANTVIGTPMTLADGTTIIPVSKISYGFAFGFRISNYKINNSFLHFS